MKDKDQNVFEGVEYSAEKVSGMTLESFEKQHKGVLWAGHADQSAKISAMHAEATRIHTENTKPVEPELSAKGNGKKN